MPKSGLQFIWQVLDTFVTFLVLYYLTIDVIKTVNTDKNFTVSGLKLLKLFTNIRSRIFRALVLY